MNIIDGIILLILLIAALRGYFKGFFLQIVSISAIVAGILVGIRASKWLSEFCSTKFGWTQPLLPIVYFVIVFLIIVLLINLLAIFVEKKLNSGALSLPNRIAGIVFSIIKSIVVLAMFIFIFNAVNSRHEFVSKSKLHNSLFFYPMENAARLIFDALDLNIGNETSTYNYIVSKEIRNI